MRHAIASALVLLIPIAASMADAQEIQWENRGQPEFRGGAVDVDGEGPIVVASGYVADEFNNNWWFVRAVDRRTGATMWEDRFGPGGFNLAKDVAVEGGRAFAAGWTFAPSPVNYNFVVRAYDLLDGRVLWAHELDLGPFYDTAKVVTARHGRVFVGGYLTSASGGADFTLLTFDAATGATLWQSVTDPTGTGAGGAVWAVAADDDHVFVLGEIGEFDHRSVECKLAIRAYDSGRGLVWQRTLEASGGDWGYPLYVAAAGDRVFFGGAELLEDGQYHEMIRAFAARNGKALWQEPFDEGSNPPGYLTLSVIRDQLFVGGTIFRGPDFSSDFVVRRYRNR